MQPASDKVPLGGRGTRMGPVGQNLLTDSKALWSRPHGGTACGEGPACVPSSKCEGGGCR